MRGEKDGAKDGESPRRTSLSTAVWIAPSTCSTTQLKSRLMTALTAKLSLVRWTAALSSGTARVAPSRWLAGNCAPGTATTWSSASFAPPSRPLRPPPAFASDAGRLLGRASAPSSRRRSWILHATPLRRCLILTRVWSSTVERSTGCSSPVLRRQRCPGRRDESVIAAS